ncbi:Small conductance calcium-activated potassium channel-like protein 3 [Diplonema papillatum]|nr:Small conductance calcium-activated potassium channel-like protein 3 [Diplonema papillatum]
MAARDLNVQMHEPFAESRSSRGKSPQKDLLNKPGQDNAHQGLASFSNADTSIRTRTTASSRKEKKTAADVIECDEQVARTVGTDWRDAKKRKLASIVTGLAALLQLALLLIQVVGILVPDAHYMIDRDADGTTHRATVRYHTIVIAQSCLVVIQVISVTVWYNLRIRNVSSYDPIWRNTPLLASHLRVPWMLEVFTLLIHEPPGLVLAWNDSYKLQIGSLIRAYVLFTAVRGFSANVGLGGRLACMIARISNDKIFQLRSWMKTYPLAFVTLCTLGGWWLCSIGLFVAEEGILTFDDAMWLSFITMTTVGYGDISPVTQTGRFMACVAAVTGLVSSALLINVVSDQLTLNDQQDKVVEFLEEAKLASTVEDLAITIVQTFWRYSRARLTEGKEDKPRLFKLKHLCSTFRKLKRRHSSYVAKVHGRLGKSELDIHISVVEAKVDRLMRHLLAPPLHTPTSAASSDDFCAPKPGPEQVNVNESLRSIATVLDNIARDQAKLSERQGTLEASVAQLLAAHTPPSAINPVPPVTATASNASENSG